MGASQRDRPQDIWATELGSGDPERRTLAARALAEVTAPSPTVVAALQVAAADADPRVRRSVAAALAADTNAGDATLDALVRLVSDTEEAVRRRAAKSLRELGAPGVSRLIALVRGAEPERVLVAIEALSGLLDAEPVASAVPTLIELLGGPDLEVAKLAAQVLGSLRTAASSAIGALVSFGSERPGLRDESVRALAGIGPPAVRAVFRGLESDQPWAIESADALLLWVDWDVHDPEDVASVLIDGAGSRDARVRLRAVLAACSSRCERRNARVAIARLAADLDPRVRAAARQYLALPDGGGTSEGSTSEDPKSRH